MSLRRRALRALLTLTLVTGAGGALAPPADAAPPASAVVTAAATPKPVVKTVSPSSGPALGGTAITISGRSFKKVRSVTLGGVKVADLRVVSSRKLTATTPPGFNGSAPLVVRTRAGKSKVTTASRFTYQDSPATDTATLDPVAGTVTATGVQWVTGGEDYADPQPGAVSPWVVGVGSDGAIPAVGDTYYLAPGGDVFPSGLAGTVTEIASQAGGITTLTVAPTALDSLFSTLDISYADPPAGSNALRRTAGDGGVSFDGLRPGTFECTHGSNGERVSFSGQLSLSLENIHKEFDMQAPTAFSDGYLSAWVRAEPVLRGSVTAQSSMECHLRDSWVDAHRVIVPVGTSGATVSFAPSASFSMDAQGTIELTQRSRRMFGITYFNGQWDTIDRRVNLGTDVTGRLHVHVEADAGVSVQVGLLDRIGVEATVTLHGTADLTAQTNPAKACVDMTAGVKLVVDGFVDVWVARWETPSYSHVWQFFTYHRCTDPADPQTGGAPEITTDRLPSAVNGSPYSAFLETADGRSGTWAFASNTFPRGLGLDPSTGEISGTPDDVGVGDYVFSVRFTGDDGATDVAQVRLYVGPPPPVGGGDFQATLTWGSFADEDLHVIDPTGEEVYYGNPQSASGGYLDRDANAGCGEQSPSPIENVYWPTGAAPDGTYTIESVIYSDCGVSDLSWHLVVRVGGAVVLDRTGSGDSPGYTVQLTHGQTVVRRIPAPDVAHTPK